MFSHRYPDKNCVARVASALPSTPIPFVGIMSSTTSECGDGGGADTYTGLRIASIFVILVTSAFGVFFPVLANRCKQLKVPIGAFESVFLVPYFPSIPCLFFL